MPTEDELLNVKKMLFALFPETPDALFMASIIGKCIEDLYYPQRRYSEVDTAIHYLNGRMYHAEICGVDPDHIRNIILKVKPDALREPWRKR